MSETVVPYRTNRAATEVAALFQTVHRLIASAKRQGIEPTEVWLGPREMEILDAADGAADADGYASTERGLAGLAVRGSMEDGVRVGVTLANVERMEG